MKITFVVAMTAGRLIAVNDKIPWHIDVDLQHFKNITMGKHIIMGRKTFDAIGKPLLGRDNIILTRDLSWEYKGVFIAHDIENAILIAKNCNNFNEICIIGGEEIFAQTLDLVNYLYISIIEHSISLNNTTLKYTFFPKIDYSQWRMIHSNRVSAYDSISKQEVLCNFLEYFRL